MKREEARRIIATWLVSSGYIDGWFDEEDVEALRMAIEALQAQPTNGRLIDADALSKKLCETTIFIKDGEVFQHMINDAPTVQADRPHGEWYNRDSDGTWATVDFAYCSECKQPIIHKHASPLWHFCPNCGADMRKEKE